MKFAIVVVALFAVVLAQDAQIISYKNDNDGLGSYSFNYETSDGESRQEEGHHENIGAEYDALKVQGSYQYYGDDGQLYQVSYIADENGFQPQGAHLPIAPEA